MGEEKEDWKRREEEKIEGLRIGRWREEEEEEIEEEKEGRSEEE